MSRNDISRFSAVPANVDIQRSKFDRSHSFKTTMNAGKLVPCFVDEVLPGDTFTLDTSYICRMSTPIFPVMDTAFLDMWFFFVPNRLLWEHWKEFNGENNVSAWTQTIDYKIPTLNPPVGGWQEGSVPDYFGIPTKTDKHPINALPLRAYRLIWNEWFRDQNLQDPKLVNLGDIETDITYKDLLPLNKRHDYFTSALPAPQKGNAVTFGLEGTLPVMTAAQPLISNVNPSIYKAFGTVPPTYDYDYVTPLTGERLLSLVGDNQNGTGYVRKSITVDSPGWYENPGEDDVSFAPANHYVDVSSVGFTVNDLRAAFAVQRLFERDARSGTRYREFIRAHFGVTVPDSTVQVPEYLGGFSNPINVSQVVQMSASDDTSPQGNTAAFSKTVGNTQSFTKSFTEHGYIIGVMGVRTLHSYQQGINRLWSRTSRLDFYLPVLANLGETPILNKEIYAYDDNGDDVFGYQEAWAEYRYKPSLVTGAFRSNSATPLDSWHYADYYDGLPYLSTSWISETDKNINRSLAVQSDVSDQFILDIWYDLKCVRPMPLYSVPGLIDHH